MLKKLLKKNSHSLFFKALAGFGRSMNRLYENRNHNITTNGELIIMKKLCRFNPSVIIDAGANTGHYTLHLKSFCPESQIYCFEPVQNTFGQLESNLEGLDKVLLVNKGLYHRNGKKTINLYPSHTHSSVYNIQGIPYDSSGTVEIEMIKGDDFVMQEGIKEIDFLKLDLEGAEYDALEGFKNSLEKGIIKMIQFEYGYINITTHHLLLDFYNFFDNFGYIIGKVFPKKVEFRDYAHKYEDFLGPNFVAVKKTEKELIESLKKR